jgi:hypothetical protein
MMSVPGTLNFPTSLDDSVSLFEAANRARSTLSASLTDVATSLTLVSGSLFPSSGALSIDDEIIYYTGKSTNTLTGLVRGRDGTSAAAHADTTPVKMWLVSSHHEALRDAIVALQGKVGITASTPTVGNILTSSANGSSVWGHAIGSTATANDGAWSSKGAATSILQGADTVADSTSGGVGGEPSLVFQTTRSGGLQGNGTTVYGFGFTATGKNDVYGIYSIGRLTSNLTGVSGAVNITTARDYLIGSPSALGSATVHLYGRWIQVEPTVAGMVSQAAQIDTNNSTGSDAPVNIATVGRTANIAIGHGPGHHNTTDILTEALNSNCSYAGWLVRANGNAQRILDFTDASFELQGTAWVCTNGSNQVTIASGGHADVEAIAGDILSINGTNATVLSATANAITLTAVFAGSTGSGLTLTKKTQPAWFANNSYLWWNNAAANAKYRAIGLGTGDVWSFDPDARGINFGGPLSGGGLVGSLFTLNGTSNGSPAGADILLNPAYSTESSGAVRIGSTGGGLYRLTVASVGVNNTRFVSTTAPSGGGAGGIFAGTSTQPTAADQRIAFLAMGASPTLDGSLRNGALIAGYSSESWTDGSAQGTHIRFETTPNGSATRAERWRVGHGGWWVGKELTANPTTTELADGDQVAIYKKADKLVIAHNVGGTINYLTIDLDGSDTTWAQGTSAP